MLCNVYLDSSAFEGSMCYKDSFGLLLHHLVNISTPADINRWKYNTT